jgi:hypothetical protein
VLCGAGFCVLSSEPPLLQIQKQNIFNASSNERNRMQKNVKLICKRIFNNRKYISQLQTLRQVGNILHANILHQRGATAAISAHTEILATRYTLWGLVFSRFYIKVELADTVNRLVKGWGGGRYRDCIL